MTDAYAVISKKDVSRWFDFLKSKGDLYGPKKKQTAFVFDPVEKIEEVSLTYIPTILPPKKYYFPPKESILKFKRQPFEAARPPQAMQDIILFAVHTCDIAGIQCLDIVFNEKPSDPYYLDRRDHVTVIGFECMEYCDRFASCTAVGTHVPKGGYDVMMTDTGNDFALHINSSRGQELVAGQSYIRDMSEEDRMRLKKAQAAKQKEFHHEFKADLKEVDAAFEAGFFAGAVWDDVGRRCVGCTNCTAVCPTCYCFDVSDDMSLNFNDCERTRVWSYCQMDDFAKVATGEDFRAGRNSRQRHRYYRKFKYSVQKYNKYFCTGCGRCTRTCMANIKLIETVNSLIDARRGA